MTFLMTLLPRVLAVAVVGFHVWLIFSGLVPNLVSRPIHLALALPYVFLFVPTRGPIDRVVSWSFGVGGILGCLFVLVERAALEEQYGYVEGPMQIGVAVLLLATVLEMARRAIRWALPAVAAIALAYALFGEALPGQFGHAGIPWQSVLGTLVITEGGLWGELTGVSVNVVAVFVMLGAFVGAGEGGAGFMALATRLAGRLRAGAAKVSVLSSAFFGSISGSASANVASTGAVTLPAMRRLGYPAPFAAAVEAVASTGGQIMPPLMGAGAFVMVELLRTSYTQIMAAAILPALLFFWAVWAGVDRFAVRHGLVGMGRDALPGRDELLRTVPFFLVPFGILLGLLFATGTTPQYAAGWAIVAAAMLLVLDRHGTVSLPAWGGRLLDACETAARQIAQIASIIICAGIVVGVLHLTGLGIKVTSVIISLSGGELWPALLLTAAACLILGMEVPTTAAYVICVSVAGPALEELGLPALHAHLFVFWYALLSTITPPVCGTVFIAAGMADAPWLKVAGVAMRLGLGLYLVPLGFIANPALVHPDSMPLLAAAALVKLALGLWLIGRGMIGADRPDGRMVVLRLAAIAGGLTIVFLGGLG